MDPAVKAYFQKITSKGGKARAAKLTPERRKEIAAKGAEARWAKSMANIDASLERIAELQKKNDAGLKVLGRKTRALVTRAKALTDLERKNRRKRKKANA